MKPFTKILIASALAVALQCGSVFAQGQGQRPDFANMNPEQMQEMIQQRIMENLRQQLAVTNDAEWNIIQGRLSKVSTLRMNSMMNGGGLGMLGGMGGRRGGGMGGPGGGGRGFAAAFGQQDPATETLQKCIDNDSPASQLKDALTRLRDNRKQKQAELAKAQADLRAVLTLKQEAILVVSGMLD